MPNRSPEATFQDLVTTATALALARPEQTRALLESLDPYESYRLWLELIRVAKGRQPPREMSKGLRDLLPLIVADATIHVPMRRSVH
jgi:hypothetical protein